MYWVSRVTRAVDEGRLELYYQPITPTSSASPVLPAFYELLVRLRDDGGELVLPGEFIPAAERYNMVAAIDRWVVQRAVKALREHATGAEPPFLFALNLSGMSLGDRGFLEFVLSLTEEPAIARGLCFEITETAVISSMTEAVYFMRELKKRGCRFALDDFGSGLSSFHYLKNLPVDFLKIDGQFISSVTTDAVDRSMVEAISHVGRTLGIAPAGRVRAGLLHCKAGFHRDPAPRGVKDQLAVLTARDDAHRRDQEFSCGHLRIIALHIWTACGVWR
jgi:EAL domain-containing protein (putative c-di-GMP-specific phosphodiesterase class I)